MAPCLLRPNGLLAARTFQWLEIFDAPNEHPSMPLHLHIFSDYFANLHSLKGHAGMLYKHFRLRVFYYRISDQVSRLQSSKLET